ncbi:hypothetical protein [Pseudovibrio sp. JE062]|uniref:hypothetical protein n=1 Tax=Pseudovibrio sp. JE062 TaxID=439495 RepID=UPI000186C34D|nr:hypothetical protein [Pseudovibrio sp. JE062]EEA92819.1 conserved hypothetical protein [Pseudovibrio sp. JE062]
MRILLSHPIWKRLYGPYGVTNVSSALEQLLHEWDDNLAISLFWEELHHQGDLYPITYAALPWLWHATQELPSRSVEALFFFSCVLKCAAYADASFEGKENYSGELRGLSLCQKDHAHPWLSDELRLTVEDLEILNALKGWFEQTAPIIAEACLASCEGRKQSEVAALISGPVVWKGSTHLADAIQLWGDGETFEEAVEGEPSSQDLAVANHVMERFSKIDAELCVFLQEYIAFKGGGKADK